MIRRTELDTALIGLQKELLRLGSLTEEAISDAIAALRKQDVALADKVVEGDNEIDRLHLEIEDRCLKTIATQQPAAKDLRKISTAIRLTLELERIADHAVDIAKITKRIAGTPFIKPLVDIPRMAEICQQMIQEGLDAYVNEDVSRAVNMSEMDHQVDQLYKQIFRELLTFMLEDPRNIAQATHLLFVARFLERVGDHATNIAESILYLVEGERRDLND